jgi:predicted Fe-Mo cluster-binding NifX family protein
MKLCVTSTGANLDAKADGSFGRANYFLIIDTETLDFESISNTAANAPQGAGIAAAQTICDKKVDALLTGYVGPKALRALEISDVQVYEGVDINETVKDAVHKFNKGFYQEKSEDSKPYDMAPGRGKGRRCGGRGMGRGQRGALT